jgi:O-antigen ligase
LYLLIGAADELWQGFFQPGAADYRFTGHVHPNLQGSFCAAICLGTLCLLDRPGSMRYALVALAVIAFAFLLLTKSRTATIALLAGCAVIGGFRLSGRQRLVLGLSAAWLLSVAVLAASVGGVDVPRVASETVLINRTDDAISLTGRVPLWQNLIALIDNRILIGFGYGSFWTPQHIRFASGVVGSGISHAHCGYLEVVLNVGLVGLAIYSLAVAATLREACRGCRVAPEAGNLFLAALLCFALVHAISEALFVTTSFVPFFAACGMWHFAFRNADAPDLAKAHAARGRQTIYHGAALAGGPQT